MCLLAVHETGRGQSIVFVHGTPTCSYEYRLVFQQLSAHYHCFAVDHFGFGESAKPRDGDYSLKSHQKRLRETLLERGVRKFHLVVHDFGGVVGLPLLWDPDFEVLSLTLLNTWAWPLIETEPQMKGQEWAVKLGLLEFLYRYFNFSPRFLLKLAWGEASPLDPKLHQYYIQQFPRASDRSGAIGFMKALFDFSHPAWQVKSKLLQIQQPVLIVWGMADKLISKRNLARWREWLPQAEVHELKAVGHFVAEEAPTEFAGILQTFLKQQSA